MDGYRNRWVNYLLLSENLSAVELLLIPILFALVALVVPGKLQRPFALIGSLIAVGAALCAYGRFNPAAVYQSITPTCLSEYIAPFGLTFQMGYDGVSLVMVLLTTIITFLILLSNYQNAAIASEKRFNAMVFLMQFALLGVFLANDGMLFYIFWELSLLPVFLLFFWYGAPERRKALMTFFIYTFVGSLAMLFSLIYIKSFAPSFEHGDLVAVAMTSQTACWVFGGFFIAFAVKIPLFPFHTWQPQTYTKSPMAGTMLLSALMLKMALFGMLKWLMPLAPEALPCMRPLIITLGVIGVIYAAIMAIKQSDIKTTFAYASISHVGLIAAGLVLLNIDTLAGAMVQIVNHSFVAVGLFLCADVIERRLNTRNLYELGGLATQAPKFAFWFGCIVFAGVSVPLTSGFIGEFFLLKGLFQYNAWTGILAGTTLIFACVYTFRAFQLSMFGPSKGFNFPDLHVTEWLAFFIIMMVVVFLGLYPQFIFDLVNPSLETIVQQILN